MADTQPSSEGGTKRPPALQPMANAARSPPAKDSPLRQPASPQLGHRQSFAENLRNHPSSPRAQRHPSLSQQALQDLLSNPPTGGKNGSSEFSGRDWRTIQVGEVVNILQIRFVEKHTSVEAATEVLVQAGSPNVVLIRESASSSTAIGTFDYSDLNAYLLLVVGRSQPPEDQIEFFNNIIQKGRDGKPIPISDVKDLAKKEPLVTLPHNASLAKAVEVFGSGIHRIVVVEERTSEVVGVLTQLLLVRFLWEHRASFPALDQLYSQAIKDLNIGSRTVIAINGDSPLTDALELMNNEGITSLPVLDNSHNVIGNISNVDVRLLTKSTSLPLLQSSCIHFISVILTERGVHDGKDSYPVFHVTPFSTLAHTVAKLIATRSHRMWLVDQPSPASSGPPTPASTPAVLVPPPVISTTGSGTLPSYNAAPPTSISAAAIPGSSLSGRLSGVVSLTDILNLFARASGLSPHDPNETRRARRRSSSSSVRRSMSSARSESIDIAGRSGR